MILSPDLTLEAVLGGAVVANQPEFHVDYVLWNKDGLRSKPASYRGALNSASDVTLLAAPQVGFIAEVMGVSIYNKDSVSATVTVKTTDGSTDRIRVVQALSAGETLVWTPITGWSVI